MQFCRWSMTPQLPFPCWIEIWYRSTYICPSNILVFRNRLTWSIFLCLFFSCILRAKVCMQYFFWLHVVHFDEGHKRADDWQSTRYCGVSQEASEKSRMSKSIRVRELYNKVKRLRIIMAMIWVYRQKEIHEPVWMEQRETDRYWVGILDGNELCSLLLLFEKCIISGCRHWYRCSQKSSGQIKNQIMA